MNTPTTTSDSADPAGPSAVGRPREFDHEAVVAAVVDLFWEKGCAATSITDIVACTGLSKSSLYGAFGSKDDIYRTALEHYLADHEANVAEMLTDATGGLDAIDAFLDLALQQVESAGQGRGCFAVNTATELGASEPVLTEFGVRHRSIMREGFAAALQRAVVLDGFDQSRVPGTANLLVAASLGTAVLVRGGASADEVRGQVDAVKGSLRADIEADRPIG